jgi:hypothetical protein
MTNSFDREPKFKDIYADCEAEANIIVKITGDSEPDDWPMWLQIAWDKTGRTPGAVYPAAINDDSWLQVMDFDGNVHQVREGDALAWNLGGVAYKDLLAFDQPQVYVIPKENQQLDQLNAKHLQLQSTLTNA